MPFHCTGMDKADVNPSAGFCSVKVVFGTVGVLYWMTFTIDEAPRENETVRSALSPSWFGYTTDCRYDCFNVKVEFWESTV